MAHDISSAIRDNQGRGKVGDFLKDKIQDGSNLSTAFCPHCMTVTNLRVSIISSIATEPDSKEKIVASRTYHCEACGIFVSAEEEPIS